MFGVFYCFSSPIQKEANAIEENVPPNSQTSPLTAIMEESDNSNSSTPGKSAFTNKQMASSAAAPPNEMEKPKPTISIFNQILQKSKASAMKSTPGPDNFNFNAITPVAVARKASPFEEKMLAYNSDGNTATTSSTSSSDDYSSRTTVDIAKKVEMVTKTVEQSQMLKETPLKTFQMPATNRVLSTHRSLLSLQSQRRRPALESEFRSQKVLFTTPTAVSRPTIALMTHLGMDDSLNCYKSPSTTFLHDIDHSIGKEEAALALYQQIPSKNIQIDTKAVTAGAPKPIEEPPSKNSTSELIEEAIKLSKDDPIDIKEKEQDKNILKINGKEFVVGKKLGQGASCNVFLAYHQQTKAEYAIKVLAKHKFTDSIPF